MEFVRVNDDRIIRCRFRVVEMDEGSSILGEELRIRFYIFEFFKTKEAKLNIKFVFPCMLGIFPLFLFFFPLRISNSMGHGLTKDKLAKSIIRFPRARTRRANSFPSPLLNHAESPEARDSSRKIREGTLVHLCVYLSLSLSLRHPTPGQPNPHWADANNVCRYIVSHASLGPQIVL